MPKTQRTFCRNCFASCGLVVETEGNAILAVKPDRDHPLTSGYMCIKATSSVEWHKGLDRMSQPLKRDADGAFHPIGVETALDEIAASLQGIIDRHGPRSVAVYFGTGGKQNTLCMMTLPSLLRGIGSPYLYSSTTIDQSAKTVRASRMGSFIPGKYGVEDCDVSLIIGSNPPVSHMGYPFHPYPPSNPSRWIREAKKQGRKFIAIDPRRTEFARMADMHLQSLPGEDASVLAGMLHVIRANGWHDAAFCDRYVTSLDRLRQAVADFTPEVVAARAGIAADDLIEAARLFATAGRQSAASGTGTNMAAHSNLAEHLVEALNAVTGGYRRAGDRIPNGGVFDWPREIREGVKPPSRSWESEPKLWTEDSGLVGGEMPTSRLPNEILDGGIRVLIVIGGNLVHALGHPDKTLRAFEKLELFVNLDPRMTQTAELAHYAIPTALPYERLDSSQGVELSYAQPFAQLAPPLVDRPEGIIDDWEFLWGLARRLGVQLTMANHRYGGNHDHSEVPIDMAAKPTSAALLRAMCEKAGLSFDDLIATSGGIVYDLPPIIVQPAGADDGHRLDVCPPDVAKELDAVRREGAAEVAGQYPYRVATRRMLETLNSNFIASPETQRRWSTNPAFMSPEDMAREGLADGDAVRITSEAGSIVAYVRADQTVRDGVVSMSHLWGAVRRERDPMGRQGGNTGMLISLDDHIESINYMPRFSGIPVAITKL